MGPVLHAACLSESKARIQTTVWFQLAKLRLTTFPFFLQVPRGRLDAQMASEPPESQLIPFCTCWAPSRVQLASASGLAGRQGL